MVTCQKIWDKMFDRQESRIAVTTLHGKSLKQTLDCLSRVFDEARYAQTYVLASASRPDGWPASLRLHTLATDELMQAQGCLCCAMRSEIPAFLAQLFMAMLARTEKPVRVIVVVTGSQDSDALVQTLAHTPFLAQRYVYRESGESSVSPS